MNKNKITHNRTSNLTHRRKKKSFNCRLPSLPSPSFICRGRDLTLLHTQKSELHLHSHLLGPVSTCDFFLQTSMILFSFLEGVKGSGGEGNRELSSSVSDTGHFSSSFTLWLYIPHTHTHTHADSDKGAHSQRLSEDGVRVHEK